MQPVTKWMSYANVTATLALFVALGGGAWALSTNSVGSRAIKKDAVRSQEIDNETIKAKDVKPGTLGPNQIADGSVGTAEIADGGVGSGDLAANAVVADKLANGAVVNSKLADNAIGSGKIANGAIGAPEIENGAVGKPEISDDGVGSAEVIDGSLGGGDIAGNSLTGAQIDESSLGTVADANTIGGRSFVYGEAAPDAPSQEMIVALPALGAELRTDGDPDTDLQVMWANTGPFAKVDLACPTGTASAGPAAPVETGAFGGVQTMVCFAVNPDDPAGPSRALVFCANDLHSGLIRCEVLQTS